MIAKWINDPTPVWDRIKPFLVDDEGEFVTEGDFVGVFDDEKMAGAFYVRPMNVFCYEVHGGVAPEYWGNGVKVCTVFGRFLFDKSVCMKIVAFVPEYNRLMRTCLQCCGMKPEGKITKSFFKHYRSYDQYVYGITKGESLCLQS